MGFVLVGLVDSIVGCFAGFVGNTVGFVVGSLDDFGSYTFDCFEDGKDGCNFGSYFVGLVVGTVSYFDGCNFDSYFVGLVVDTVD